MTITATFNGTASETATVGGTPVAGAPYTRVLGSWSPSGIIALVGFAINWLFSGKSINASLGASLGEPNPDGSATLTEFVTATDNFPLLPVEIYSGEFKDQPTAVEVSVLKNLIPEGETVTYTGKVTLSVTA